MADQLNGVTHPDPEVIHTPAVRKRPARRRLRRWVSSITFALIFLQLAPYLGVFAPVFSPLVYANLAPPDWHNATPHGQLVLGDFAFSADDPGLAFACASLFTLAWPEPWSVGGTRYWRSTDSGAHWQMFQPPFGSPQDCNLALPPGGNGTVLAVASSSYNSAPATLWISHDAGNTWHKVVTASAGDAAESLQVDIHSVVYRKGMMYDTGGGGLTVSTDDGATWTTLETSPDRLEQQGWQVDSIVPDYQSDGWWYRTLSQAGSIPMLEHSQDDGATWSVVGPIGPLPLGGFDLATTPQLPGHLCAGHISGKTSQVTLLASGDGGRTWRTSTMPSTMGNVQGETSPNVAIGDNGDCYEGFHYGIGQDPKEGNSHYGFLRLASDSTVLHDIPLTDDGNSLNPNFTYVPASNGMTSRLVAELNGRYPGWAPLLSGLAAETTDGQIVWHAVP